MKDPCPYCGDQAELVTGVVIYPHRPDLADKKFYVCRPCAAYVGCHPGTDIPLGRLADLELRKAKQKAHAAFDPLWLGTLLHRPEMKRRAAYVWLAKALGLSEAETHIGMFDVETCLKVVAAVKAKEKS